MEWMLTGFLAGVLVSFLGSLPPGILNATIVQLSLQRGMGAAFGFAAACVVVEVSYSYLAILLATSLMELGRYHVAVEIFSTGLLLAAGVYYLRKKEAGLSNKTLSRPFYLGIGLSLVNVVAIPFWVVYTALLTGQGWIMVMDGAGIALYLGGIALGTLLALELFAFSGRYLSRRLSLSGGLVNQAVGLIMVATALFQIVHLFL